MNTETLFQIAVGLVGSLAAALCALAYFRRVRLERPPIGVFNTRDLCVLGVFIVALPVLYVHVAPGVLTAFIVVTFLSALTIALRPLFPSRPLWVAIPLVLTADILVTRSMDDMRGGLQLYWLLTSAVVLVAAVGVANLYVQGGLELRQIAYFTLFLAVYDIFFTRVIALTPLLAVALQGRPLDPSVGFAAGAYNANVGLGDLLVFCLYAIAAYKAHGRRGAVTALGVIAVFGAVAPAVTPLVAPGLFGTTAAAFVPIQALFGPAAFVAYRWLARTSAEPGAVKAPAPRRARPAAARRAGLALPGLAVAGLIVATVAGTGDVTATSAAAAPAPSGPAIAMRDVAFTPTTLHVKVGTTVTWTNDDRVPHNVVATSGARFGSTNLLQHATYRFRALRPGTIRYECTLHQGMRGTIVVSR
jgi:plastocyanin